MDLYESRGFFDSKSFDAYDFDSASWVLAAFKGKLDLANPKISLMDKGTRRRMLFLSPGNEPTSSIIRCAPTGQLFMCGQQSKDMLDNRYYRNTVSLHEPVGTAVVNRRLPVGPPENPGWAVSSLVETTFADFELRSDNENQESQITQWGSYMLTLPNDSQLQMHDTVTVDGRTFFVFQVYRDSGFVACHATDRGDDRYDIVYKTVGAGIYDPSTLTTDKAATNYNVTAQITPYKDQQDENASTVKTAIKVMIKKTWIGVEPKKLDIITFDGQDYIVSKVTQNQLQDEWHLVANV